MSKKPKVEKLDYWNGKAFYVHNKMFVNFIKYTITSGDNLWESIIPSRVNLLLENGTLLVNVLAYRQLADNYAKQTAVEIASEDVLIVKKFAKRIKIYKDVKGN